MTDRERRRRKQVAATLGLDPGEVSLEWVDGWLALPHSTTLSTSQLSDLCELGVQRVTALDTAQVPGDQHPQLAVSFRKADRC